MRSLGYSIIGGAALLFAAATARGEEPKTPLQPTKPVAAASLQLYIKVKDQVLAEYCKSEGLGVPRCTPGALYEAEDSCAPPYKVASVSCALSDLGAEPRLVETAADSDQMTGRCVWAFGKLATDKAPTATTTLFCVK